MSVLRVRGTPKGTPKPIVLIVMLCRLCEKDTPHRQRTHRKGQTRAGWHYVCEVCPPRTAAVSLNFDDAEDIQEHSCEACGGRTPHSTRWDTRPARKIGDCFVCRYKPTEAKQKATVEAIRVRREEIDHLDNESMFRKHVPILTYSNHVGETPWGKKHRLDGYDAWLAETRRLEASTQRGTTQLTREALIPTEPFPTPPTSAKKKP